MILDALRQAEGELAKFTQFRQDSDQSSQLLATLAKLSEVSRIAATLRVRHKILSARVRKEIAVDFEIRVDATLRKLEESHAKFASSPWQVKSLESVQSDLNRLINELQSAWTAYSQRAIMPKQELFRLLKELPEVKQSGQAIQRAFDELTALSQTSPKDESVLQHFDRELAQITDRLTNVNDITPVIQDFLQRTHQGTFTIADLNEEILNWCRMNERGRSFNIRA